MVPRTLFLHPVLPFPPINDSVSLVGLSDTKLAERLTKSTRGVYKGLEKVTVDFSTFRKESFDTISADSLLKKPTIESVACFLQEHPIVDARKTWDGVIAQIRLGRDKNRGDDLDCSNLFAADTFVIDQSVFDEWVEELGTVPRSFSTVGRLPYRVSGIFVILFFYFMLLGFELFFFVAPT